MGNAGRGKFAQLAEIVMDSSTDGHGWEGEEDTNEHELTRRDRGRENLGKINHGQSLQEETEQTEGIEDEIEDEDEICAAPGSLVQSRTLIRTGANNQPHNRNRAASSMIFTPSFWALSSFEPASSPATT